MAYISVTDFNGTEHDIQVIDVDTDIRISREFGKYIPLGEIPDCEDEEIADLKSDIKDLKEDLRIAENEKDHYEYEVIQLTDRIDSLNSEIDSLREEIKFNVH